jgi:hypothetical protein
MGQKQSAVPDAGAATAAVAAESSSPETYVNLEESMSSELFEKLPEAITEFASVKSIDEGISAFTSRFVPFLHVCPALMIISFVIM